MLKRETFVLVRVSLLETTEKESIKNNNKLKMSGEKKSLTNVVDNTSTIEEIEIEVELEKAQEKWMCLKERRHQSPKECLLDL